MGQSEFKNKAYKTCFRVFCSFTMTGLAWALHSYCLLMTRPCVSNLYIQVPSTVRSSDSVTILALIKMCIFIPVAFLFLSQAMGAYRAQHSLTFNC